MVVAITKSETKSGKAAAKFSAEMFADVPVLQRKWQAALRPGEKLPRYEDVVVQQVQEVIQKKGSGDLAKLLKAGDTWEVK